jgi:type II secretory pathway component PulK
MTPGNSGIALIAVMTALIVLSAVAVTMAVSIQTEAKIDSANFESLQAEQLARSGQEFALFIQNRGLTTNPDLMAGLPFEAVAPGFHYQARVTSGTIDIYFEADNGRINLRSARPELLTNFFALWTGDSAKAQVIADSVADWNDRDDDSRPNGAEAAFYAGLNVMPRNGPLGIADLPFVRGMSAGDFQLRLIPSERETQFRQSINSYLTDAPGDGLINLNFAPQLVLQAIPGLTASQVTALIAMRRDRLFVDMNAVQARTGLNPESQAWRYLTVSSSSPAILTVAKLNRSGLARSERRIAYYSTQLNFATGAFEQKPALGRIERNTVPDF